MNLLLLTSHAIAEYDDLRMFTDMGVNVFSIGGAYDEVPFEGKRPQIGHALAFPEFVELNHRWRAELTEKYGDPAHYIDWAKARLHPDIIDWADVIVVHHFPDRWIGGQWHNIKHKRVIWRTCGQSDPDLERFMAQYKGLQIVRYSPAERRYFESVGSFAGEDALIRFGKYPDDYGPWTGDWLMERRDPVSVVGGDKGVPFVANVTQNMTGRGEAVGLSFYLAATEGLPAAPAGPGSEELPGGLGALDDKMMRAYLAGARAYLYTGTAPASYTLGLMEAMLSGVPVVSISPAAWAGPDELFEGHELATVYADDPKTARGQLERILDTPEVAESLSREVRKRAVELFGIETISAQWRDFLGVARRDRAMRVGAWDRVI